MKKNVAGQKVGCQLLNTDGTPFEGPTVVYVTGDAGTQAAGSVGSGAGTHEGNGYHTYSPAQAETNYDLAAFTFTGSGIPPATVQIYTDFPQTGDGYAIVNSGTFGNSIIHGLLDTEIAAIISSLSTIAGYLDTEINAIKAKTDNLPTDPADQSLVIAATDAIVAAIAALNNLSSAQAETAAAAALTAYDPPTNAEMVARTIATADYSTATALAAAKTVVDAIKVVTDALTSSAAAKLALSGGQIIVGTVDSTVTPSTTVFEADDITEATADHYNGRVIIFTSGALAGQATAISDYSLASGKGHFTVVQLTEAPANNDTFIIV